ncbi:aryl-sulfate sulfotransferase [Haloarchaeobius sp. HME9146]|uniref:aryl-sulfate sulfotransferase n=1 Tax=Haloarchaeobius sp. HME9146 TaxID=2978732 RepID=UPI0021C01132|nr:aryl-sulfate sulfotransferase [Haloarchaeobius sp. HME9146]
MTRLPLHLRRLTSALSRVREPGGRARLFALLALVCLATALAGYATAPAEPRLTVAEERPQHNTLIGLQGYADEGRVIEVSPDGEVVWEYDGPGDIFDVEAVNASTVQVATADTVPDSDCPEPYASDETDGCVRNALQLVDRDTTDVVWEYAWYDVEKHEHELHDADRYVVDGEPRYVLVDMGNDRVFAVDESGEKLWQWNATDTYDRPDDMGPESDWTHMNDVDRIEPGVFQVSLRNFDTVVELHVADDGSVRVEPVIGPNQFAGAAGPLYEQHNPDRLGDGSLLVADSEHDRIVEFDSDGQVTWQAGGSGLFDWPRDGDRLSNGHTLVTDSYNDRVVELDENGEVVWAVETGDLPYEADRVQPREPATADGSADGPSASEAELSSNIVAGSTVGSYLELAVSISKYVLPNGLAEQLYALLATIVLLGVAGVEGYRAR